MADARMLKRRHLSNYLRVSDRDTGQLLGHIADITAEGVRLFGERAIEPNTTLQCRMDLPIATRGNKHVAFDARSIWCQKGYNPDYYDTGLQLKNVSTRDADIITHLIQSSVFRN